MSDVTYKLDELARAAGTSARTVRYYVQRGLLPAPAFRGKDSAYAHEHLVRLRAIRRLQDAYLPLDAIAVELGRRSLAEIERIADGLEIPAAVSPVQTVVPALRHSHAVSSSLPAASSRVHVVRMVRRIEIAPGVELSVADDAPVESRLLAEKILEELQMK